MCGIIGQLAFEEPDDKKEKIRQESMIFLGSELLQLTSERGEDATGVSLMFGDGNYMGLKMGISPIEFIARFGKNEKEYGGIIKFWRDSKKPVKTFLGHCRKKSRGSEKDNNNNHPIKVGDIIGIHNGTLDNDDKIFKNLACERDGDVDSEAIFRLLHHFSNNGKEPFSLDMMEEVISRLDGKFSVLGTSGNNPYQVCSFRDGRPMEFALITPLKLLLIASEKKFIDIAIFRYNKYINLYIQDTEFPTVRKGDVEYKTLVDDSACIFDLRKEIGPKSTVDDLMDWRKIPRVKLKEYKAASSTRFYGVRSIDKSSTTKLSTILNNTVQNKSVVKHINNSANNKSCKTKGKIWSKKAKKYITAFTDTDVDETKNIGNVEIDIDSGKVEDVVKHVKEVQESEKTSDSNKFELEIGKDADKSCAMSSVNIKELEGPKNHMKDAKIVEVDVAVDIEAIEKAEECINMEPIFENEKEVIDALDIPDQETLKVLPIFSLANRMRKCIMKAGFMKGYSARKSEEQEINKYELSGYVRTLKSVLDVYKRIIYCAGLDDNESVIERLLIASIEDGSDITEDMLNKLFKPGDERKDKIIRHIKKLVINRGSKNKQVGQ